MKKGALFITTLFITAFIISCNSAISTQNNKVSTSYKNVESHRIVATAKKYLGTPYKWAGTTNRGMDCSGLVYTTFLENGYELPRPSRDQAKIGETISIKKTVPGDLVFFKTDHSSKINHVGIVVENNNNNIQFIHTSSSKGVIISSMNEVYWNRNYQHAKRLTNNASEQSTKNAHFYKVKTGDTLYSIAKAFDTTIENLKNRNNLKSNTIDVGMLLKIN